MECARTELGEGPRGPTGGRTDGRSGGDPGRDPEQEGQPLRGCRGGAQGVPLGPRPRVVSLQGARREGAPPLSPWAALARVPALMPRGLGHACDPEASAAGGLSRQLPPRLRTERSPGGPQLPGPRQRERPGLS